MSARVRYACFLVTIAAAFWPQLVRAQAEHPGQAVYDRWCIECHGAEGQGATGHQARSFLSRVLERALQFALVGQSALLG